MTSTAAPLSTSPRELTKEMISEVRVSMPAAAGGVDNDKDLAATAPPPSLLWRALRFLALRAADAVVYAMCAALCLASVGSTLCVLGPRIGGGAGARAIDAGNFLGTAGAYLFPFVIVALPLMVMAHLAKPDKEPAPRRESSKGSSTVRAVWGYLLSDPVYFLLAFYFLVAVGLLPELLALEKGSLWEKAGSILLVVGAVGAAIMNCCFVCPKWARDWRAGQQSIANKRN